KNFPVFSQLAGKSGLFRDEFARDSLLQRRVSCEPGSPNPIRPKLGRLVDLAKQLGNVSGGRANGDCPDLREVPARLAGRRADQIASLKPLATRNATFFDALLALIRISSPVAGLRPFLAGRAGRTRTCRTPRLGMRILLPFFSTRPMS